MIELKLEHETAYIRLIPHEGRFTLLDVPTLKEIRSVLRRLEFSPAKVIRILGEGGCFAVGADLKTMYSYDGMDAKGFSVLGNSLFGLMRRMPQIIIAEIDGFCMGGGMDFAAACDFRLAVRHSKFAHPGPKLGIITGFGGTQAIPRLMRPAHLQELFNTGDIFEADFMRESGYLWQTFPDRATMLDYSSGLAEKLTRTDRELLAMMKREIMQG
ncbi:enoyl-CoA hydratase/isomerase family protein [Limisalsivibrio acetivorans]|uniref:enoyl-CoA hydratase/isomerase family protein n=1 Tax=Limisalsivibrio acetivorans TaxID=1304888 RepID=UPI0003B33AEE|nr:enoyl-CoA hydratase/isomerase family protein [Limisalsivibrio acetivorans]